MMQREGYLAMMQMLSLSRDEINSVKDRTDQMKLNFDRVMVQRSKEIELPHSTFFPDELDFAKPCPSSSIRTKSISGTLKSSPLMCSRSNSQIISICGSGSPC